MYGVLFLGGGVTHRKNNKFSSETKDKLVSSEARTVVENIVSDKLSKILETDRKLAASIVERAIRLAKGREAARKARELVKN